MDWIQLAQGADHRRILVVTVMNLRIIKDAIYLKVVNDCKKR
jgi:hypothetical protein